MAAVAEEYKPAMQDPLPAVGEYVPAPQLAQVAAVTAPVEVEYMPALHVRQAEAPTPVK